MKEPVTRNLWSQSVPTWELTAPAVPNHFSS